MSFKIWLLAMFGSVALFASAPAWSNETVDLNTATVKELQSVKGIGPKTAAAIVEHRNTHGKFKSVDELTEVKGVGSKKLKKIRGKVRVGNDKKVMMKEKKEKKTKKREQMNQEGD